MHEKNKDQNWFCDFCWNCPILLISPTSILGHVYYHPKCYIRKVVTFASLNRASALFVSKVRPSHLSLYEILKGVPSLDRRSCMVAQPAITHSEAQNHRVILWVYVQNPLKDTIWINLASKNNPMASTRVCFEPLAIDRQSHIASSGFLTRFSWYWSFQPLR